LRQRIVAHQPDVVVSFLTNVNVNALLATWGLSVPVIVCERTNPRFSRSSGRVLSWLRKLTYPRARVVSAQTDHAATMLQHDLGLARKPAVLPNPMPPALVDQKPASLEPDAHGRMRLLALGRLVPQKQFDRLITAFGNLASDFPDWDLWIWGEGSQREALNAQVAQAGLNGRVLLPGRTTQPWAEMQQATAFALTSRVEGFPNGLLEAMACGLPCVAFDCPSGPAELLEGGHAGELVPLNDMARLEDALRRMLVNPEHRQQLGRAGRNAVLRRYALPAVLGLWDDVFVEMGVRP
jgi:glycosyltransferase involved in cell wall biosynthesis